MVVVAPTVEPIDRGPVTTDPVVHSRSTQAKGNRHRSGVRAERKPGGRRRAAVNCAHPTGQEQRERACVQGGSFACSGDQCRQRFWRCPLP